MPAPDAPWSELAHPADHKYGGPLVDPNELQLQFRLSFVASFVGNLQFIEKDIYSEGPSLEEWKSIHSRWDAKIMGQWNTRCRTIAIIQLLGFYEAANLYTTFMNWVDSNPEYCRLQPA